MVCSIANRARIKCKELNWFQKWLWLALLTIHSKLECWRIKDFISATSRSESFVDPSESHFSTSIEVSRFDWLFTSNFQNEHFQNPNPATLNSLFPQVPHCSIVAGVKALWNLKGYGFRGFERSEHHRMIKPKDLIVVYHCGENRILGYQYWFWLIRMNKTENIRIGAVCTFGMSRVLK